MGEKRKGNGQGQSCSAGLRENQEAIAASKPEAKKAKKLKIKKRPKLWRR